jgi:predicted ATPase
MASGAHRNPIPLPSGTLTMLLTDVEGSTVRWERDPVGMRRAMRRHDEIVRGAIARRSGYLPPDQGEGDSIFAVFGDAREAIACVLNVQQALFAERWEIDAIRVRAAIHTGSLDLRDGRNYSGLALNRCARMRAIASGGQTLLSAATAAVLADRLPDGATLVDLGVHRLKDLSAPEHIFELRHPDLPDAFPPLRSLDARPNNLPVQLTGFVGRSRELSEVSTLLLGTRLLTLTGAGGSGKTRLALQVAADRLERYPDGVWFVELDRVGDPADVPRAVAGAMRVREQAGRRVVETLVDHLSRQRVLLLLDNCEHVVAAAAELAGALLGSCPDLSVLSTSREPLRIAGETVFTVPGLAESVQLFTDRAAAANPGFVLHDETGPTVRAICASLDGIPLAIELAAAQLHTMTLRDLSERLDEGFRLLSRGSRTAVPRQQTLRSTIGWSVELLSAPERTLFRRLSVFAGGFDLAAAQLVCGDESEANADVVELVQALAAKSLVVLEDRGGRGRYRLLETVREYALELLVEAGEHDRLRDRHLGWCIDIAERAEPELHTGDQAASLDRLQLDLDNFRSALRWALDRGDATSALRLATALLEFWIVRADWSEGREWVERALSLAGEVDPILRARGLRASGELADVLSDYPAATDAFERALAIARQAGDDREIAAALMGLANEGERVGRAKETRPLLEEAVEILRRLGDEPSIARSLGGLAWLEENYPRARALWEEQLAIRRKLANREAVAWAVLEVGWAAEGAGDYAAARAAYEETLAIGRELSYQRIIARALTQLGDTAVLEGNVAEAGELYEQTLPIWNEIGHKSGLVDTMRGLGDVARSRGQATRARELLSETLEICREIGAREHEARTLQSMGALGLDAGDLVAAADSYRQALTLWADMEHTHGVAMCLRGLGVVAARQGDHLRGTRLIGAADALTDRIGAAIAPADRAELGSTIDLLRVALADAFENEIVAGRDLTSERAIEIALDDSDR